MRFERMIRLTMLTGAALALPGAAMAAALPAAKAVAGQAAQQSADDYQWIDRADTLWDAIGDAPPDFAFSFEGAEPWAWQTADGYTIIVEDAGEQGGIRSYYFAPGARGPFLAVEPGMSFAYEDGRLAMVYDADGEAAPRSEFGDYDDPAGDLYERALQLRDALNGRDYRPVDTDAWIDASPYIFSFIQVWDSGRSRYPGWARYRAGNQSAIWRHRFDSEQRRRREMAERFRHWREGGFQGPPPGRFHRPGRPDRPGTGRPPQPGSGWGAGGWAGRPGRPGRPGSPGTDNPPPNPGGPGTTPDGSTGPNRPPVTRPWNGNPGGSPRPWVGRPGMPGTAPGDGPSVPGTRPPGPRPDGNGGSWNGWGRPRPPVQGGTGTTPTPVPPVVTPPVTGEAPPPRPGWSRPPRPAGGWNRPTQPGTGDVSAPPRPVRPEGGWNRPGSGDASAPSRPVRPEGGWNRPGSPGSGDVSAPPRPVRPEGGWSRPNPSGSGNASPAPRPVRPEGGWQRPVPPAGGAAPAPSRPSRPEGGWSRPNPPAASPAPSRPSYTPPPAPKARVSAETPQ